MNVSNSQQYEFVLGVVNNLKDVVFQTDAVGRWKFLNPAWTELTDYTVAESLGTIFLDFVHPEDRERNTRLFAPLIAREKEYCRHTIRYRRKNGSFRWVEVFARLTLDDNGDIIGTSGTLTDITERVAAERCLKAQFDFNQAILQTVGALVMVVDRTGRVISFNPACETVTGFSATEVVGKGLWEVPFYLKEELCAAETFWQNLNDSWQPESYEATLWTRSGEMRHISWTNTALRDNEGRIIHIISAGLDITERRTFEEALRQSEARLRVLIANFQAGVLVEDEKRRIVLANQQFCDLFSIPAPPEVLTGADCSGAAAEAKELFAEPEAFVEGVDRLLAARELVTGEVVRMQGGRILERDYVPIHVGGSYRGHLWLYRDITERKVSEERLQALALELQRSNRELEHFATVASHDLQEPLRKIHMFGDRLRVEAQERLSDSGQAYLNSILIATGRMKNLIHDLLRFSRITTKAKPFTRVHLNTLIAEAVEDLEMRIRDTGGVVEIGAMPDIEADATQMRQVFQNLIGNALKFHQAGVVPVVQITAEYPMVGKEGFCQIRVTDNGIGFDPEYNEVIFDVFERLHEQGAYEGTGIGLAICRKVIERHHGTITGQGKRDEGATFLIELPLTQTMSESGKVNQRKEIKVCNV